MVITLDSPPIRSRFVHVPFAHEASSSRRAALPANPL
jgi:hypothetical protein